MRGPSQQRGLTMWGWLVIIGLLAFFSIVTVKTLPVYLNHMKVAKALNSVANDPGSGRASLVDLRRALQRHWDIEDITRVTPASIGVIQVPGGGRAFVYEYEAVEHLFYNIHILIVFQDEVPIRPGG